MMILSFIIFLFSPLFGSFILRLHYNFFQIKTYKKIVFFMLMFNIFYSIYLFHNVFSLNEEININLTNWIFLDDFSIDVNFILDKVSIYMCLIISFIALPIYFFSCENIKNTNFKRFNSYILGFLFFMFCLVLSGNLILLFFSWEGVGFFSYLLIGFFYKNSYAVKASLKAFLMNRIADLGFFLATAMILIYCKTVNYTDLFNSITIMKTINIVVFEKVSYSLLDIVAFLLILSALCKSAQFPFHTWLEGSMQAPTPVSALLHSSTMVTSGVFMLTRLAPIFLEVPFVLNIVIVLGFINCFFMGTLALVQKDIKLIVAYCTLSQLGYMMIAQGISSFSLGMFHLLTHAICKSLLFLCVGYVVTISKKRNIFQIGTIRKKMPFTSLCILIASLSLSAFPPFSGFFSKDLILHSVKMYSSILYYFILFCSLMTPLYLFRMIFLIFFGPYPLQSDQTTIDRFNLTSLSYLVLLVASLLTGFFFFNYFCLSHQHNLFFSRPLQNELFKYSMEICSANSFISNSLLDFSMFLSLLGLFTAFIFYFQFPNSIRYLMILKPVRLLYYLLRKKYFIEEIYKKIFIKNFFNIARLFYSVELFLSDKFLLGGSKKLLFFLAHNLNGIRNRYINHYIIVFFSSILLVMIHFVI